MRRIHVESTPEMEAEFTGHSVKVTLVLNPAQWSVITLTRQEARVLAEALALYLGDESGEDD